MNHDGIKGRLCFPNAIMNIIECVPAIPSPLFKGDGAGMEPGREPSQPAPSPHRLPGHRVSTGVKHLCHLRSLHGSKRGREHRCESGN